MSFLQELKRRNVFRVAAAYVAGSWLLIEVAETLFPLFGFGDAPARQVVILLAIGFIPALVFAWVFELTPEGLKRESEVDRSASITPHTGRQLDRVIIVVLVLALGVFAFDRFVLDPERDEAMAEAARQAGRSEAIVEQFGNKSIAVLPFADFSPGQDQEYFSDGITEELLNLLASVPELRVTSRHSAFTFKGSQLPISEIAQSLGVAYLLEGSVRKQGNMVRVTVQLIEGETDRHLWSQNFDRELSNVFEVQDEVASSVLEHLQVTLLDEAPRIRVADPEAYDLYLKARHLWRDNSREASESVYTLLGRALALDDGFTDAWLLQSRVLERISAKMFWDDEVKEARGDSWALTLEAVERAVALDPDSPRVLARQADLLAMDGELEKALRQLERAHDLTSGDFEVMLSTSKVMMHLGRFDEAARFRRSLLETDPANAGLYYQIGYAFVLQQDWPSARQYLGTAAELAPRGPGIRNLLTFTLVELGEAEAALEQAKLETDTNWRNLALIWAYTALDQAEQTVEPLASLVERQPAKWLAAAHVGLGEPDRALDVLTAAEPIQITLWEPWFDALHDDPRWVEWIAPALERQQAFDQISFGVPIPD